MLKIKAFKLSYSQVPKVFSLPKGIFLSDGADFTSKTSTEHTEEQRKKLTALLVQLDKDLDRTCYVDFDGNTATDLKADWLTRDLDTTKLTAEVYPDYTQGNSTSACISEIIFATHFQLPLNVIDPEAFSQLKPNKICFAYRNANGEPSGFSLVAVPKGAHMGWIISTIQNTTAHPKDRRVHVLASTNYVTTRVKSTVDGKSPDILKALKSAINNDKVFDLVKGVFCQDASLNADYIKELQLRVRASVNVDDRDRKLAQLSYLFALSKRFDDINLEEELVKVKKQITEDVTFFKDGIYETHFKVIVGQLARSLHKRLIPVKSVEEIEAVLTGVAVRVADLETLAAKVYRTKEMANTYQALAKKIKAEANTIKFDGTVADNNKIVFVSQFNVSLVQSKVEQFYKTSPEVDEYFANKKLICEDSQRKIAQLPKPSNAGFFNRNKQTIGFGLFFVMLLGATGVILTGGTLAAGLIAITAALIITGSIVGMKTYLNEKLHKEKIDQYHHHVKRINTNQHEALNLAEEKFQKNINLNLLLEPEKPKFLSTIPKSKKKTLTAQTIAHALWLDTKDSVAKNAFSLWAARKNMEFGMEEVESILRQKYTLR